MVPPEHLMHDGPPTYEQFKENGDEFYRIYLDLCGLMPNEKILDVGCGIGRKTIRLTGYLKAPGEYQGMDIVPSGIEWCTRRITSRHPHFRFQLIDVYNNHYQRRGSIARRNTVFHLKTVRSTFSPWAPSSHTWLLATWKTISPSPEGCCARAVAL